jgi:hypothetical protein
MLGVVAESLDLSQTGQHLYPLIVVHVILAFLGQAAIGSALWQSRLLAPWIGWGTILWNLSWLNRWVTLKHSNSLSDGNLGRVTTSGQAPQPPDLQ